MKFFIYVISAFIFCSFAYASDEPREEIGIIEHLGEFVPLDYSVMDETGRPVTLRELTNGKPTVLSFVYFRCPGICTPLLNGLAKSVDMVDLEPGKDFNVITLSFDHTEGYLMAKEKKESYLESISRKIDPNSWRFVTADSTTIANITNAAGWKFKKQEVDFIHGSGIMVVSPEGKLTRYLYGTDYLPLDLKLAIIEASEGRVGTTIAKLMKMCYSYDPEGRQYVLNFTRISGVFIIAILGAFLFFVVLRKKKLINSI